MEPSRRIIKTRYRDVPWEERGHGGDLRSTEQEARELWNKFRGKNVSFLTPPLKKSPHYPCEGPHYRVTGLDLMPKYGQFWVVCPHIAEIGD